MPENEYLLDNYKIESEKGDFDKKALNDFIKQKRIFNFNWNDWNAGKVVYHPKHIKPDRLQELFQYAWDTFYHDEPQPIKMYNLIKKVVEKEMEDGTYKPRVRNLAKTSFGKKVVRRTT